MCSKHGPIDWYHFLNNVSCHIFFALYIFCGWHDRIFQNIFPFLPGFNFRQYLCFPFSYKCKKCSFNGSIDYSNKHCELGGRRVKATEAISDLVPRHSSMDDNKNIPPGCNPVSASAFNKWEACVHLRDLLIKLNVLFTLAIVLP